MSDSILMDLKNTMPVVLTLLRMVYCDNTNDGKDVKRFVKKLDEQIDANRKYSEECIDAQYTLFSVNNCDMRINDLLNMYRSLFDRNDLQDSVTVITIVLESIGEHYVEKDYTDAIIIATQKLMHLKKSYIKIYDLSVKIEDVKMENIAEMDRINMKVDNIEKIHNELEKLVVESIYGFCCEIFQELLRTRLKIDLDWFLWRRHCDLEAPTLTQEYLADKYKTWIEYLDETFVYYRFRENLHRYLTIRHSLFDPIYRSICEYESYIGNKYFSSDISALKKSYVSCLKYTYDDLLDECMHAFVPIMLPIVKCTESRKQYMDLFHFACTEMLQDCEKNKIKILGCAVIENHLRRLYNREAFNSKLESYAVGLYSEQLNLKLRNAIDVIKEKFCSQKVEKRVSKIVLSKQLDMQNFNLLCRALKETQSVKHMCEKQFMFLDFYKCLNEEQIRFDANKCRSFVSCFSNVINVAVFSRFKSHGDLHATTQLLRYETKFAQFKENVVTTNLETIAVEPRRPIITLSRCDITNYAMECKESILQQIYKCLGPNKNKLMSLQVIQLNGIANPTSIYIFDSICEETKSAKNTVIYDICQKDKTTFFGIFSAPSEYIKCFDNVSVLYLEDLLFYIQSIFLTNCTLFQIPNLCTINNNNLVYQEKTFDLTTPINLFFVTKSYLDNLYNFLNPHRMLQGIQVKYIVKYYKSNCTNISDCYVKDFVKNLGIGESAFFQIFYSFILNKNPAYKPEDIPYKIRKRTYSLYGVQVYVKHHIAKSAVLVLSEVSSCNTYNNLSTNLNRILASLRANENDLAVWEFLDYVLSSIGAKMTIVELIIEDMCKAMQMDVEQKLCKNIGAGVQNCIKAILRSIDTLYIPNKVNVKKSSKSTHNPRIAAVKSIKPPRHYLKAEEVEHFVETIANELRDLVRKKTFKFTAIKLGYVKEPYYWYEVDTIELPNCNEQYDDLSHFDCQKCQVLYIFDKAG